MKILFLNTPAFAKQDMIDAFTASGVQCVLFTHNDYNERQSEAFAGAFSQFVEAEAFDFAFSFNYFPVLSNCCQKHSLKYVSYVYDSPLVALYSCTLINSCNYVFLFDKATYFTFLNAGITNVYYLPLAANTTRLQNMVCPSHLKPVFTSETSFVGSIYNEEHNFFDRLDKISDYTRGYLEAIMNAQQKIYGQFFLEDALTPDILKDLQNALPYSPLPDGAETDAYVYANYFLCRKITSRERLELLRLASEASHLKLFTHNPVAELPKAEFIGPIDWYDTMPYIFKHSDININITLKSIQSGIPLRCMDIMGSGGFLLTNFQSDLLDYFIPDEDFIFYNDNDDFTNKITYYLKHDNERRQIAANAFGKMQEQHTFIHRVQFILNTLKD